MVTVGIAGCSPDATRFYDNPFSNPFASQPPANVPVATGSVPSVQAAPVGRVEQAALAQPLPAPAEPGNGPGAPHGAGSASLSVSSPSGAPPGVATPVRTEITGSIRAPQAGPAASVPSGSSREEGLVVTVGSGETVTKLARRYGVSVAAIMQANNMTNPAALQAGQRLIIPRTYGARSPAGTAATQKAAGAQGAAAPGATAGERGNIHIVAPGETLTSIAKRYRKSLTELAAANNIAPHTLVKVGDRIVIPGHAVAQKGAPVKTSEPAPQAAASAPAAPQNEKIAAVPQPQAATPVARLATPAAEATAGVPSFRWPVTGRVIEGFGPKPNGQQNDGVNLAVPEGTAIRAAEDGVVAYAGNELKGYGNLILIRHANGYVTAYAHASEILVKRNDPVRRGQIIAKSGQTGAVTTPQLHFEIRKGSTPVDPMQYLPPPGA